MTNQNRPAGDGPRGYGDDERDRPRFVQHTGQSGPGQNQYGTYGNQLSQHGGYADTRGGHRGKGPQSFTRSDERLREHVCELLTEHDEIDPSNLEVAVTNGEVMLTGTVEDRHQRRMIEDLVEGVSGVKDVHMSIKLHDAKPPRA
jgi:osmotically-inducible protein OsmY